MKRTWEDFCWKLDLALRCWTSRYLSPISWTDAWRFADEYVKHHRAQSLKWQQSA